MYSVAVDYPENYHHPSKSVTPCLSIITGDSIKRRKLTLSEVINAIFDGDHDRIFGANKHVEPGEPSHIILSNTRWQ